MIKSKDAEKLDYKQYIAGQIYRSKAKWNKTSRESIFRINFKTMWDKIKYLINEPEKIGCMGIRSGAEYFEFKKLYPKAEIYGIEINPQVKRVGDNCFDYDFNNLPKDWENKFDIVFSNSLDHAFKVEDTIKEWRRVCRGQLIIDFSKHDDIGAIDRYKFVKEDVKTLFPNDEIQGIFESETNTFWAIIKLNKKYD